MVLSVSHPFRRFRQTECERRTLRAMIAKFVSENAWIREHDLGFGSNIAIGRDEMLRT